ncbi:MAG: type II secretion system protein [Thermosipho sp. (in: Bacteria)]|nr:type II secretion system protein [Thermosipho sp. (in: thermotogales)]
MKKGFTLIELIVVMAIIAFLLTVAVPIALNAVKKANVTQIGRNLRNLGQAGETYINVENPEGVSNLTISLLKSKNYLEISMKDSEIAKYDIVATDVGNFLVIESIYLGKDIATNLIIEKFPFLDSTDNIIYYRIKMGKWWE